jgi:phenylacetate-CoA ligase
MSISLQIYHKMPAWTRTLAASARGYYLNSWRYDKHTEKLVEEALERDFWSAQQWREWRENRLSFTLRRAATLVPFYREQWAERRRRGDNASCEYLENWMILEKQILRARAAEFVADDLMRRKMFHDHTSGTTGTSLDLWFSAQTVKHWYALFEARCRRWYGGSRRDRWAILGGQLVVPIRHRKSPFWVWNAGMKQLYMSSFHLAPDLIKYYADALVRYRVSYILGYPSALFTLAQEILRQKRKDVQMIVAISNAEPLLEYQRETISQAFNCPVRETYGMAEIVAAASDCERGKLHLWQDVGLIEDHKDSSLENRPQDFICTGLINADMPLIRYRVGDCGSFSDEMCDCGRTLPLIEKIEGRSDDVLFTADGRRVGRLDPIFKSNLHVKEAQIIQKSLNKIIVKLVPDSAFNQQSAKNLSAAIRERLGDVEVIIEKVAAIPRTERGKFRAVICELPATERFKLNQ